MELDGEMMSGPLSLVPLLRSRSLVLSLFRSLALSLSLSPPRASGCSMQIL